MKVHADNFPNPDLGPLSAAKYYYKEAVAEVDLHTGDIIKALEEAGVLENTFVFFTSDNGPQMDSWPDGGYTPFRGGKGTTFEGGPRVPGIACWPGMIKPGRQSDELFDLMDLFGTALNLAGVSRTSCPMTATTISSTRPPSCSTMRVNPPARRSISGGAPRSQRAGCRNTRFT